MRRALLAMCVLLAMDDVISSTCAPPSVCNPPPASFTKIHWEKPRIQWNINGGFCGSFSLQTLMMTHGAWVSEDLIRKANIGAKCFGHGNGPNSTICMSRNDSSCISSAPEGCEVGPENYEETCRGDRPPYTLTLTPKWLAPFIFLPLFPHETMVH